MPIRKNACITLNYHFVFISFAVESHCLLIRSTRDSSALWKMHESRYRIGYLFSFWILFFPFFCCLSFAPTIIKSKKVTWNKIYSQRYSVISTDDFHSPFRNGSNFPIWNPKKLCIYTNWLVYSWEKRCLGKKWKFKNTSFSRTCHSRALKLSACMHFQCDTSLFEIVVWICLHSEMRGDNLLAHLACWNTWYERFMCFCMCMKRHWWILLRRINVNKIFGTPRILCDGIEVTTTFSLHSLFFISLSYSFSTIAIDAVQRNGCICVLNLCVCTGMSEFVFWYRSLNRRNPYFIHSKHVSLKSWKLLGTFRISGCLVSISVFA